jgi:hypothetical protein
MTFLAGRDGKIRVRIFTKQSENSSFVLCCVVDTVVGQRVLAHIRALCLATSASTADDPM